MKSIVYQNDGIYTRIISSRACYLDYHVEPNGLYMYSGDYVVVSIPREWDVSNILSNQVNLILQKSNFVVFDLDVDLLPDWKTLVPTPKWVEGKKIQTVVEKSVLNHHSVVVHCKELHYIVGFMDFETQPNHTVLHNNVYTQLEGLLLKYSEAPGWAYE